MPVIKSSKKRVRQTARKTARNSRLKRDIRSASQAFEEKLAGGKKTEIANAQTKLNGLLDRASKKNLFHRNKTARRKSRVARMAKQAAGSKKS